MVSSRFVKGPVGGATGARVSAPKLGRCGGQQCSRLRARGRDGTGQLAAATGPRPGGRRPIEYSHSLAEQIGGQLAAGFILTHLDEAPHHADATARYMHGYFVTRAVKP
jgi:hypothetical protein